MVRDGHFRTSDRPEVRPADVRFQSTAAIGQPPLEDARSPRQTFTISRRWAALGTSRTSAARSAGQALPTHCGPPSTREGKHAFTQGSVPNLCGRGRTRLASGPRKRAATRSKDSLTPMRWPKNAAHTLHSRLARLKGRSSRPFGIRSDHSSGSTPSPWGAGARTL